MYGMYGILYMLTYQKAGLLYLVSPYTLAPCCFITAQHKFKRTHTCMQFVRFSSTLWSCCHNYAAMMKINIKSYKNINLKFALFVLRLSRKAFKIAINVVSDEEKNEQSEAKRKMEIGKRKKTQKRRTICAMQIRLNCDYTGSMCIRIAYVQGAILQKYLLYMYVYAKFLHSTMS